MEEATFLSRFASKVLVVHRRTEFRASPIMVDRARANDKLEFVLDAVVEEVLGEADGHVTGVRIQDTTTGESRVLDADGVFVAIGHDPTTALFLDWLDHDEQGYLVTDAGSTRTNIPGVFAAGDVQDHTYRQAVTAASSARWPPSTRSASSKSSSTARKSPRPPPATPRFRPQAALGSAVVRARWIDLLEPTARSFWRRFRTGSIRRSWRPCPRARRRAHAAATRDAWRLRLRGAPRRPGPAGGNGSLSGSRLRRHSPPPRDGPEDAGRRYAVGPRPARDPAAATCPLGRSSFVWSTMSLTPSPTPWSPSTARSRSWKTVRRLAQRVVRRRIGTCDTTSSRHGAPSAPCGEPFGDRRLAPASGSKGAFPTRSSVSSRTPTRR